MEVKMGTNPDHVVRECCMHNTKMYPEPTGEYKRNNMTQCYYYTMHGQTVPDNAYVNFCCLHRNKKFYDSIEQLPNRYKALVFRKLHV